MILKLVKCNYLKHFKNKLEKKIIKTKDDKYLFNGWIINKSKNIVCGTVYNKAGDVIYVGFLENEIKNNFGIQFKDNKIEYIGFFSNGSLQSGKTKYMAGSYNFNLIFHIHHQNFITNHVLKYYKCMGFSFSDKYEFSKKINGITYSIRKNRIELHTSLKVIRNIWNDKLYYGGTNTENNSRMGFGIEYSPNRAAKNTSTPYKMGYWVNDKLYYGFVVTGNNCISSVVYDFKEMKII
jgi:hypothetical protein